MQLRTRNLLWAGLAAFVLGCVPGNPAIDMSSCPDLAKPPDMTSPSDMAKPPSLYVWPHYFVLPVAKASGVKLTQTWIYKNPELPLHPDLPQHYANDLQAPWGTPVYAAADGWMVCSYEVERDDEPDPANPGKTRKLGFGYGLYCRIAHYDLVDEDGNALHSLYGHMSALVNSSDYKAPEHVGAMGPDDWSTSKYFRLPPDEFKKIARFVKQGEQIGNMGHTGLGLDYTEQPSYPPMVDDTTPTWDPAGSHLHWQLVVLDPTTFAPWYSVDPFKLHRQLGPRYADVLTTRARGLIIANDDGSPKYAY